MYAVVRTGGKQYKVESGQRLEVERLVADAGSEVELPALLLVDGDRVLATPDQLGGTRVTARVVEEGKGKKIHRLTYKSKSNHSRPRGHHQRYSLLEITNIAAG